MTRSPLASLVLAGVFGLLGATTCAVIAEAQQQPRVSVELDPGDVVGLDESAILRIKVETGGAGRGTPLIDFELDNMELVAGPSQSTNVRIYNGVPSTSVTFSWQLRPQDVGSARVHTIRMQLGDQVYELPERSLEIVEEGPIRSRSNDPFDRMFNDPFDRDPFSRRSNRRNRTRPTAKAPEVYLRSEIRPANPYPGQQVLFTLNLYTQVTIQDATTIELPDFKGFWTKTIPQPDQLEPEMVEIDGEQFGRFALLQRALFPRRAGRLEIEPVEVSMQALVHDNSIFGSLMPRPHQITRKSPAVEVEVRELPTAPPNYQGIVGRLQLDVALDRAQIDVGEAATLTINLEGEGHLQGAAAPEIPPIDGIEVFPPQQQSSESIRRRKVRGKRIWSFVLVPNRSGQVVIPAIEIPYFDPIAERFEFATSDEIPLQVNGATSLAQTDQGNNIDLHPIRNAALPSLDRNRFSWSAVEPWLLFSPWLLAVLGLAWGLRSGTASPPRSPIGNTPRKALLASIGAASREDQPRVAAAAIEDAWRNYLSLRWKIPTGTASTQWGKLLDEHGLDHSVGVDLMKLADDLHYLRYAPKLSSTEDVRSELVDRSQRLAKKLK